MHVAVETISWGPHPDVDRMLRDIKAAGYEGVEFSQHPADLIRPPVKNADGLYANMKFHRLKLVGMARGALQEKVDFIRQMIQAEDLDLSSAPPHSVDPFRVTYVDERAKSRPYAYIDDWQDSFVRVLATSEVVVLAIHPHMFRPVQTTAEAERLLEKYPQLRFLPDTAHLTVAGDDILQVLERTYNSIEAIHLRDWSAEFGRAYQFYSRGFRELGTGGDVPMKKVIALLKDRGFGRWLVVEHDTPGDAVGSAQRSRAWLRAMGV